MYQHFISDYNECQLFIDIYFFISKICKQNYVNKYN